MNEATLRRREVGGSYFHVHGELLGNPPRSSDDFGKSWTNPAAAPILFGDRLHRRDDPRRVLFLGNEFLHSLIAHSPSVGLTLTVILPGQNAFRQWRPGQNPQVQRFRHGNQFALDRPLNEAVLDLQPDELCPASKLGKSICLGAPPLQPKARCDDIYGTARRN